jgi:hypothetical protein
MRKYMTEIARQCKNNRVEGKSGKTIELFPALGNEATFSRDKMG